MCAELLVRNADLRALCVISRKNGEHIAQRPLQEHLLQRRSLFSGSVRNYCSN